MDYSEFKYYNKERKLRYIDIKISAITIDEHLLRMVLSKVSDVEVEKHKDVCDFTEKEAIEYLTSLNKRSYDSVNSEYYIISQYVDWCLTQGFVIDGQNHFKTLTVDMIKSCVNLMAADSAIISRKELLEGFKYIENPRDQFILLAAFEFGIKDKYKDIQSARITDIEGNRLHLEGRDVMITNRLKHLAEDAYEETKYYVNGKVFSYFAPSDRIVKYAKQAKGDGEIRRQTIYRVIYKALKDLDYEGLRPKDLERSGIIHLVKSMAKKHGMTTRQIVGNKKAYEFIKRQYGFNTYWSTFWNKNERWLT